MNFKVTDFFGRSWVFGIEDFFRTRCGECGQPAEGRRGSRRPTTGSRRRRGAGATPALTRSQGPQGDNIKRTSITTDQHLQDLTRLGPEAQRILFFLSLLFIGERPINCLLGIYRFLRQRQKRQGMFSALGYPWAR